MVIDFENLLNLVGGYGKYQKKLLALVLVPCSFFIAVMVNLIYFQLIVPEYWCHVSGRNSSKYSVQEWKELTVPKNADGLYDKCLQFEHFRDDNLNYGMEFKNQTRLHDTTTQECVNGWDHDTSVYWETIATEEEWLCKKEIFSTHILAFNMAGNAVGTFTLPLVADRFTGRRLMFFIALAIHLIFNLAILVVRQFYLQAVFRFLAGLAFQTIMNLPYIVTLEFLIPEYRTMASFLCFSSWTFGMCFSALIAYLVPHWWYLVLLSIAPSLLLFTLWRVFPESPRWLLSKGKLDECSRILLQVARTNKVKGVTSQILQEKLKVLWEIEIESRIKIRQVFSFPRLCRNGIVILFIALLSWMTYGCVLLNMSIIPNHYFLNFFIISIIELPSDVYGWLSVNYLGRRMTSLLTYLSAAIVCFLAVISIHNRVLLLVMVAAIKFFITGGIYVVYVMASEVFPTPVRSTIFGFVIASSTLGMLVSPYIIEAGEVFEYSIMVALHLICLLLGLLLPETIGLPLPQTLQDAEILGQERPFFKWIHHWNVKKWIPCDTKLTNDKI